MHKPWYTRLYVKSPVLKLLLGILSVGGGIVLIALLFVIEPARMQAQTDNWDGRSIENGAEIFANNCSSCHGVDGKGVPGPALNSRYFFTQRLDDVGFTGSVEDYVALTVEAGRPSKMHPQWGGLIMATWGEDYGGPLRNDQVRDVARYVANWESSAMQQTLADDPWIPFEDTPSTVALEDVYREGGAEAAGPSEPRPPEELFVSMACAGCHVLDQPQTADNRGPVGPNLGNLSENAAQRIEGMSAEEYVYQSIVNPNAHIVDTYQPNVMTQTFAQQMTEEEIRNMVDWLLEPDR